MSRQPRSQASQKTARAARTRAAAAPARAAAAPSTALVVTAPTTKLRAPTGGFRTETVRDAKIIAHIAAKPGFTVSEYGDQLGVFAFEINTCLLYTRGGRALAEKGNIRVPTRGRTPRWAKLVTNRAGLVRRQRTNQFTLSQIDGVEDGDILGRSMAQMKFARQIALHASPRLRKEMIEGLDQQVIASATAHTQLLANVQNLIQTAAAKAALAAATDVATALQGANPAAKAA